MTLLKHKRKLSNILPTVFLVFLLYLLSRLIPQSEIERLVVQAGPFAPITFVFIALLTHIIAPLSGTPIASVGFQLFGGQVVFLIAVAAFISFSINFWIARKWGREAVIKIAGEDSLNTIDKYTKNKGYISLFFLRIFLGTYHDFISYAAGLTSMRYLPYLIASTLGVIPGTLIWYSLVKDAPTALHFVIHTLVLISIMIIIYWLWHKKTESHT